MAPTVPTEVVTRLLRTRADPGTVVRIFRTALHMTQGELGRRCGYSASQVSRWETGRLPLRDVRLLQTLADVLAVPPILFGLSDPAARASLPAAAGGPRVGRVTTPPAEEDDPVRRRTFFRLAALTGGALAMPGAAGAFADTLDPADVLTDRLGDILLGPAPAAPTAPGAALTEALAAARREFTACRYLALADRLPALISAAEATAATTDHPDAHRVLAESYNLATRALMKLKASGLEWISADRAVHAARQGQAPLTLAEAQRLVASVARRAGDHRRARDLTLDAASQLDITGPRPAPEHLAGYATLHLSASYAAALDGDRDRAHDSLAEARTTADRLADDPDRHRTLVANLVSHQVSAAYELGDTGTALAHARSLPLAAIPTTERRARLLVDTARAWAQGDRPDQAYRTLLDAERTAPGEVRTRNAVRLLVTDLMNAPRQAAMPGLPALAQRVHAVA
ncbi:helix-turn-helix transcriptional regulator [Saccharothrix sp. NPDC042600]|uniref:helix-turn-helix transcriptional regulator n=1 Tax=Saccharothrix TaxID=2071 RepID=UPI0033E6FDD7